MESIKKAWPSSPGPGFGAEGELELAFDVDWRYVDGATGWYAAAILQKAHEDIFLLVVLVGVVSGRRI